MAEVFVNSLTPSAGIVATNQAGIIAANATTITGISTLNVGLGYMVDNQNSIIQNSPLGIFVG